MTHMNYRKRFALTNTKHNKNELRLVKFAGGNIDVGQLAMNLYQSPNSRSEFILQMIKPIVTQV